MHLLLDKTPYPPSHVPGLPWGCWCIAVPNTSVPVLPRGTIFNVHWPSQYRCFSLNVPRLQQNGRHFADTLKWIFWKQVFHVLIVNALYIWPKWSTFSRHFEMDFLETNISYFDYKCIEVWSKRSTFCKHYEMEFLKTDLLYSDSKYIEVGPKWSAFCRHFEMDFLETDIPYFDSKCIEIWPKWSTFCRHFGMNFC